MGLKKEIDGIEARITQAKALIDDKLAFTKKHEDRKRAVDLDLQKTADEIRGFEKQKARLETDVLDLKKLMDQEQGSLDKLLGQASNFSKQFFEARKTMDTATESMQKCKDELGVLQTEVAKSQELVRLKSEEHARLKRGVFSDFSEPLAALETQRKALRDALSPIEKSLNEFFSEEKEVNQRLPKLETLLLDLREKMTVSESKLRIAGDSSSKALEAVLSLRSKEKGIYGTVGELVRYPSNYSVPISVSLGNRFQYVVVDSVKTAGKAIEFLKNQGHGRVSFIPLDRIQIPHADESLSPKKSPFGFFFDLL